MWEMETSGVLNRMVAVVGTVDHVVLVLSLAARDPDDRLEDCTALASLQARKIRAQLDRASA